MGASFLFVYKNLTSPGLHASKLVAQPLERFSGKPDPFCSDADLRRCGSQAACLPFLRPADNATKTTFDWIPYGLSVPFAGARLGHPFGAHLIIRRAPKMGALWETTVSPFSRRAHQKKGPKGTPPEALHRTFEAMENSNTHTFGAVRGAWAGSILGVYLGVPCLRPEPPIRQGGVLGDVPFGVPFRGHLIV